MFAASHLTSNAAPHPVAAPLVAPQQALGPWLLQGLPYKIFKLGRRAVADLCAATDLVGFPSHARHAFAAATDTGVRSDHVFAH